MGKSNALYQNPGATRKRLYGDNDDNDKNDNGHDDDDDDGFPRQSRVGGPTSVGVPIYKLSTATARGLCTNRPGALRSTARGHCME